MASKEEPVGSFSCSHPFKFINSRKGKKALVMDGFIFHHHSKFKAITYFKCSHRMKGCGAGVSLKNFNQNNCSFDSYVIVNGQHLNHLPDPDKIRKKEERLNKIPLEKSKVDLKSPEFLNSKHVCLFCLSSLPSNLASQTLENVVPYGPPLTISLDNPTKNSQAFDLLCSLLNVKWKRTLDSRSRRQFDQTIPLPLCLKCQNLYQEVFQLNIQIRELEALINKRIMVIRGLVEKSGEIEEENIDIGETQLALLGLDYFRMKVKDVNFNLGYDADADETQSPSTTTPVAAPVTKVEPEVDLPIPPPSSTSPIFEQPIVKQEVNPEEEDPLEDNYVADWLTDDMDTQSNFDNDTINLPPGDKISPTSLTPRSRSTRLAAQRASAKVTATVTSGSDDDTTNSQKSDHHSDTTTTDGNPSDSESDTEIKINSKTKKSTNRLSSLSISRPIRYLPQKLKPSTKYNPKVKPYSCNICSKFLLGNRSLLSHYSTDHPDKPPFTCKFCPKTYKEFRTVLQHQRVHTGEKPFKCPHCPFSSRNRFSLPQHISNRHSKKPKIPEVPCPSCPKKFPSQTILTNHLISSHGHTPSQNIYKKSGKPIKYLTCHLCPFKIQGHGPFAQHYLEAHPNHKKYTCKFCPAHFPYIREVITHQRRHTGDRPFKCDICPKTFLNEKGLQSHKNIRHSQTPAKFQCSQCPKAFPIKSILTTHIAYHHRDRSSGGNFEKVTFCKICGKAFRHPSGFPPHNQKIHKGTASLSSPVTDFSSLETLQTTLGIHFHEDQKVKCHLCWKLIISDKHFIQKHFTDEHSDHKGSPLHCGQCGKRFNRFRNCVSHVIRRHSDTPKGYHCDKCVSSFYTEVELEKHQITHKPIEERKKGHVCEECGEGMISAWALSYHKKRKHRKGEGEEGVDKVKWICDECGKEYSEKRGLEAHKKVVHRRELKWRCEVEGCGKRFAERITLRRHERNHRGEKEFSCGWCGRGFVHPTSKTRHEREVHGVGEGGRKRKTERRRGIKEEGGVV